MTDPLVALYRADWIRWSFSAEVVTRQNVPVARLFGDQVADEIRHPSYGVIAIPPRRANPAAPDSATLAADQQWESTRDRILVAPGGRYRYEPSFETGGLADLEDLENDERVTLVLSDGELYCEVRSSEGERSQADRALTPVDWIVRPAWMMSRLRLTLTGTTELAGRSMLMVRGTPRPRPHRWAIGIELLDWVDFLVDAELGLVRRRQAMYQGQPLSVFEVRDFTLAPPSASDPASFRPDDNVDVDDQRPHRASSLWRAADWERVGWPAIGHDLTAARVAVGAAKSALYLAARGLSRPEPSRAAPAEETGRSPTSEPAESAPVAAALVVAAEPVSDRTVRLIAQVDLPPLSLSAQVLHWLDLRHGIFAGHELTVGLDEYDRRVSANFLGTEGGPFRSKDGGRRASLLVAMPGRYRIDFGGDQGDRQPRTIACDGERLRKVYHNRVIASPAQPLPTDYLTLVDPAWLLADWQLTEGGQETFSGRSVIRVQAVPPAHPSQFCLTDPPSDLRIDLLIDLELGIVLRQVSFVDDQPVARIELLEVTVPASVDPFEFGSAIAPDLPVTSTSGEPIDDLDLPPVAKSIRDVSSGLLALFRRPR